jgi:segregation and condensation protein B
MNLKSTIESLLFVSAKPLKSKELAKILEKPLTEVQDAVNELVTDRKDSGVVVLDNNGEYQMATNSANSTAVKNFLNAELREKLTDATVEVLAIIAYRQPISKAEIEAIRGVNSQYSIRALLMRGLIEKISNPSDQRSFLYQTTTEFLQHLGVSSTKDLPDFEKLVDQIKLPEIVAQTAAAPADQEAPAKPSENFTAISTGPGIPENPAAELTDEDIKGAEYDKEKEIQVKKEPEEEDTEDEFDEEDDEDEDEQ